MKKIAKFSKAIISLRDRDCKTESEERDFLRGVAQGLMDLEEGREMNLADVRKRFGLS